MEPSATPQEALVLGLGESGLAMARWLAGAGWSVRAADTRSEPPLRAALERELPQVRLAAGGPLDAALLGDAALVAVSPGLSLRQEPLRSLVAAATAAGVQTVGEIELFARALAQLRESRAYAPVLIGITGTNGKTTTVRMAGRMVAASGRSVRVAGNVSPPALQALQEALAAGALPDVWVLELSSFQLASTRSLRCAAAGILNITPDHLDWHGTLEDYAACKLRLLEGAAAAVVNRDDPATLPAAARAPARVMTFGLAAPDGPGQYGIVRDEGMDWLACTDEEDAPRRRRRTPRPGAEPAPPPPAEPLHVRRLMPVEALPVRGLGAALAPGARIVVLLGGDGKGQSFEALAAPVTAHARAAIVYGADGPRIALALAAAGVPVLPAASLPAAVCQAAALAQPGDVVLLSPACASFDAYRNYADRAAAFIDAVRALPGAAADAEGGQ